jgi:hypothetical protein
MGIERIARHPIICPKNENGWQRELPAVSFFVVNI